MSTLRLGRNACLCVSDYGPFVSCTLIDCASLILLLADLDGRRDAEARATTGSAFPRIAIVQHATIDPLDEGVRGVLAALV